VVRQLLELAARLSAVRGRRGSRLSLHDDEHLSPPRRPWCCQRRWWPQRDLV